MTEVEFTYRPDVSRPLMLCAFRGWNDGGEAASAAAVHLRNGWEGKRFARIDPEGFFDFQVNRPTVRLEDGLQRHLEWPACEFFHAKPGRRDVVLFIGVEPNVRWRAFTRVILDVARELDVGLLVTLGAFLANVPHTLPAQVSAASSDPAWLEKPGVTPTRYEGPTGIVGVLHDAAAEIGLPSVSLWAAAPHYLPVGCNPRVALALLERVRDLLELDVETEGMSEAADAWDRTVAEALEEDADLAEYVRRLEEVAVEQGGLGRMPTGEDLAQEFERYLRDHGGDHR